MTMQTEQELNAQVQSLVSQRMFQTAADVIADWAYWDMIGRFDDPAPEEPIVVVPERKKQEGRAGEGGSMKGQLHDRMTEEFGEAGWKA